MIGIRIHVGRLLLACAAVVGQFVPASAAWVCGPSCCSASASQSCCGRSAARQADLDAPCPLCAPQPIEQGAPPPCHCHLKARHDSATPIVGRVAFEPERVARFAVVHVSAESTATSAALTRLALASGAAIPSRPPRIVFGVWRN